VAKNIVAICPCLEALCEAAFKDNGLDDMEEET
jgi:hypothetical protein